MDFHCIEALFGLPKFRVIDQVIGPTVRIASIGLGKRVRPLPSARSGPTGSIARCEKKFLRGCPDSDLAHRYGLSERTVFRWTFEKSRGGRPRKLGRATGIDAYARRKGIGTIRSLSIWTKANLLRPLRAAAPRMLSPGSQAAHPPNSTGWKLLKLIERPQQSAQEPLNHIAGTLHRWFEPIVRSIRNRYSNGMTKGFNNKIKRIQRMAYGLRNEHNRRKRILAYCGKT